jgi:hypothetical protein
MNLDTMSTPLHVEIHRQLGEHTKCLQRRTQKDKNGR